MSSIFTKIINGDIPSYKIAEDNQHYAFLDINPLVKGHTLVIPKIEEDYIFDLSDAQIAALHIFAKKVAVGIKKVIPCKRVGSLVIGTEVPHAHIHLIPFEEEAVFNITRPKLNINPDEMAEIAFKISQAI